MNSIDVLRDEYPGSSASKRFVAVFRPHWNQVTDQASYLNAIKDEEIAVVLAANMGPEALDWFNRPSPALDGNSPSNVLSTDPAGLKIVRTLLMRMPR